MDNTEKKKEQMHVISYAFWKKHQLFLLFRKSISFCYQVSVLFANAYFAFVCFWSVKFGFGRLNSVLSAF